MFQIISALVIIIMLLYFIRLFSVKKISGKSVGSFFNKEFSSVFEAIRSANDSGALFEVIRRTLLVTTAFLFTLMAISGFIPVLFFGAHLSGWLLIIHVSIAPFFVLTIALLAVLYAHRKQFNQADLEFMGNKNKIASGNLRVTFWSKVSLWLFLLFSLPAILSVVLSMFPIFGTYGQDMSLSIHQYSVLILLIVAMFFLSVKLVRYAGEQEVA